MKSRFKYCPRLKLVEGCVCHQWGYYLQLLLAANRHQWRSRIVHNSYPGHFLPPPLPTQHWQGASLAFQCHCHPAADRWVAPSLDHVTDRTSTLQPFHNTFLPCDRLRTCKVVTGVPMSKSVDRNHLSFQSCMVLTEVWKTWKGYKTLSQTFTWNLQNKQYFYVAFVPHVRLFIDLSKL